MKSFLRSSGGIVILMLGALLALMMGTTVHEVVSSRDRPVAIHGVEVQHPVVAGEQLYVAIDATVYRRCAAETWWVISAENGIRMWSWLGHVGYTPAGPRKTIMASPPKPLPQVLPPGTYELVINRIDRCPERTYAHPTYAYQMRVP